MALTSMKIDKAAAKRAMEPSTLADEGPAYPYGLEVRLDKDSIEKLGMKQLPEVGETMMLVGKVKVTGTSSSDHQHGKHQSVTLQITDMALEDGGDKTDAAKKLYEG